MELQLLLLQQEDEEDCPLHLPRTLALQPGNREHGTNGENCCGFRRIRGKIVVLD